MPVEVQNYNASLRGGELREDFQLNYGAPQYQQLELSIRSKVYQFAGRASKKERALVYY